MASCVIVAEYKTSSSFTVPKGVPLLPKAENEVKKFSNAPWTWWVIWDTLRYIDDKGVEHEIAPDEDEDYIEERKRPLGVRMLGGY